jgi:uncharacterized coiled-coil protein SlyX
MNVEATEARLKALENQVKHQESQIKTLENQVGILRDIEEIKKLQRAYGYYLEHWMAKEVIDCFADGPDVVLILYVGTFLGKEGIRRFFNTFFSRGEQESPELLHQVMQLAGIVDVATGGETAEGRWYGWGANAVPMGGGITQSYMGGVYECEYVKEGGKWKIKKLQFSRTLFFPPGEGWVKPGRLVVIDHQAVGRGLEPDIQRAFEPGYPSGYILPFHYKHPVTGQATTEGIRNSSVEGLGND